MTKPGCSLLEWNSFILSSSLFPLKILERLVDIHTSKVAPSWDIHRTYISMHNRQDGPWRQPSTVFMRRGIQGWSCADSFSGPWGSAAWWYLQGGVLYSLLWSHLVEGYLVWPSKESLYGQGYLKTWSCWYLGNVRVLFQSSCICLWV